MNSSTEQRKQWNDKVKEEVSEWNEGKVVKWSHAIPVLRGRNALNGTEDDGTVMADYNQVTDFEGITITGRPPLFSTAQLVVGLLTLF